MMTRHDGEKIYFIIQFFLKHNNQGKNRNWMILEY